MVSSYARIEPVSIVVTISIYGRLSRRPFGLSTSIPTNVTEFVVVFLALSKEMLAGEEPVLGNNRFIKKFFICRSSYHRPYSLKY